MEVLLTAYETAKRITELAQEKKGQQITLMNISSLADFADYFVLISADSTIQVKAICDHIEEELKKEGFRYYQKEGYQYLHWVLLDYIDVIIHIFLKDTRQFYDLERLWADAEIELIADAV